MTMTCAHDLCGAIPANRSRDEVVRTTRRLAALRAAMLAAALSACAAQLASAQVYKCTDAAGRAVYSDTPCGSASRPMRLPDEPTKSSASPTACAQLDDELNRLDAQAARNAAHGRKESASDARRRQTLARQYAARCSSIRLSTPPKK